MNTKILSLMYELHLCKDHLAGPRLVHFAASEEHSEKNESVGEERVKLDKTPKERVLAQKKIAERGEKLKKIIDEKDKDKDMEVSEIESKINDATPYTFEQIKAAFDKYTSETWCIEFLENPDNAEKRKIFLEQVDKADKDMLEWAITSKPTEGEKKRVNEILNNKIPDTEEMRTNFVKQYGPRALMAAEAIAADAIKGTEEENADALKQAAAAGGFMVILEKFLKKLTELFERMEGKISEMFKKTPDAKKALDTSPIGGDKKFEISQDFGQTKGNGVELTAESSGQDVTSVAAGEVIKIEGNKITIKSGEAKIIYVGVSAPIVKVNQTVNKGQKLGIMAGATLSFQLIDKDNKQIDPTPLLKTFIKENQAAALELTPLPDKATVSPIPSPFKIKNSFEDSNKTGVVLGTTKGIAVQMMADGVIKSIGDDSVEISYKNGKTLIYKGLKDITTKAGDNITAGTNIGVVSDVGELRLQITKEGDTAQIDPTSFIEKFIQNPAALTSS